MKTGTRAAAAAMLALAAGAVHAGAPPKPGAEPPVAPSVSVEKDAEVIRRADLFSLGGVGVAGTKTAPNKATEAIIARKDGAASVFLRLLSDRTTTAEGKLFALYGLLRTDPAAFAREAPRFRGSRTEVRTAHGCMLGMETMGAALKGIESRRPKPAAPTKI